MGKIKTLKRGESLFHSGHFGSVWRLTQGLVRLERVGRDGPSLVQLALPGDLLGVESLFEEPHLYGATALTPVVAREQVLSSELSRFSVIAKGYLQQQRRMHDMMRMRTGCVSERIAHLLNLLSSQSNGLPASLDRRDLPILKDLAFIVDASAETVCRELNAFIPARVYQRPTFALAV
jgi:CRP-like cAMP-binding protein